jgi:regulator of sigma E protease
MNLVLSIVMVSYLYTQGVQVPVGKVRVIEVVKNSPAEAVGLSVGDIIKRIEIKNDSEDKTIEIETGDTLGKTVRDHLGERLLLTVDHQGKESLVSITPRKEYPSDEGPMGVAISDSEKKVYSIWEAPIVGTKESFQRSQAIVSGIVTTVVKLVSGKSVGGDIGGPIRIAKMTGEVRRLGILPLLDLMGLLSLNLAIINILPFPALDGGRLFFVIIEGIIGKKVKPAFEQYAHLIGMAVLITLIVLISINDVIRLVSGK